MVKFNIYNFYNLSIFLLPLLLSGCGKTLINPTSSIEIINENSLLLTVKDFRLTKLHNEVDFDLLPKGLSQYKKQLGKYDFYYAQSPTQGSAGFAFEIVQKSGIFAICLRKPAPSKIVAAVLSNPVALVIAKKGLVVEDNLGYCET